MFTRLAWAPMWDSSLCSSQQNVSPDLWSGGFGTASFVFIWVPAKGCSYRGPVSSRRISGACFRLLLASVCSSSPGIARSIMDRMGKYAPFPVIRGGKWRVPPQKLNIAVVWDLAELWFRMLGNNLILPTQKDSSTVLVSSSNLRLRELSLILWDGSKHGSFQSSLGLALAP